MPTIPRRPAAQRCWRAEVRRLRTAGLFAADVRAGVYLDEEHSYNSRQGSPVASARVLR